MFAKLVSKAQKPVLIQGGPFRIDKGPTHAETSSFKHAIVLHDEFGKQGGGSTLGCVINDLALSPSERPKATGILPFPTEYLELLQQAGISPEDVLVFYESTLRNQVKCDFDRRKLRVATKINESTGFPVPICRSIMGRFYYNLAKLGFATQIGFYLAEKPLFEEDERKDNACVFGPIEGALSGGYQTPLTTINFLVKTDGSIGNPFILERKD